MVLGAAGGIGGAVTTSLAAAGYRVVGVDATADDGRLADLPGVIGHVVGDVRDPSTVERCFSVVDQHDAQATVLVTSVLAAPATPLTELDEAALRETLDILYVAAWRWSRELLERRTGGTPLSVVHVGSVHAFRAAAGFGAYAAAKAALLGLTRASAVEWGPRGLRCNAVAPGFVPVERNRHRWSDSEEVRRLTASLPLRRSVRAEDVAAAVTFLASPQAAGITGTCLPVDAGLLSTFGTDV